MNRIKSVLKNLQQDSFLVSKNTNIFYLTGFSGFEYEREAYVLLTKNKNYIFTSGIYSQVVKKSIPFLTLVELNSKNSFDMKFSEIVKQEKIITCIVSFSDLKVNEAALLKKYVKIKDDKYLVENGRKIKDGVEIKELKKASILGDKIFNYILGEIKLGVTEVEIAKKIEIFTLQNNASTAFESVVAFGPNSSSPHHVPTNKKLTKNTIVLLDFGVKINGYCSDMTRTVYFGIANDKFKKIYLTVREAQQKAFEFIKLKSKEKKSIIATEIDKIARDYIISQGFESIPHSLGHGIGIEVHESPRLSPSSKDKLYPDMVFSIEPGIYIPGYGGVRIEDLVLLTNKEPVLISNARSEIIEL